MVGNQNALIATLLPKTSQFIETWIYESFSKCKIVYKFIDPKMSLKIFMNHDSDKYT